MHKPLKKAITALALSLSAVPGVLHAEPANSSSTSIVALPIDGPLYMRETKQGTTVIMSADGRFVMPGRLVDRENDHNMILSIADAQKAFGSQKEGGDRRGSVEKEKASAENPSQSPRLDPDQLLSFTVGKADEGREEVFVWIDPTCPHCHTVLKMQSQMTDRYVFHNLLIPMLGANAEDLVNQLVCTSESERRDVVMARNRAVKMQEKCFDDQLRNNQKLATRLNISAVPVIITADNRMAQGAPRTQAQFAQFLENKR